jgi:uncharacterized protein
MTVLVVAAISARMLAEAAAADGFEVVALDLYGDRDTRRAAAQWLPIGDAAGRRIDAERLLSALAMLAQRPRVTGWIAGTGFEGRPDLLARASALVPLVGTAADQVRRVRDPSAFFDALDAHGIAHPAVQRGCVPTDATGWLVKDAHGCGGWHIQRAEADQVLAPSHYAQREVEGTPMSATFIANGSDACVIGFNQLVVRPLLARPYVFCGAIGPVALPAEMAARIGAAARTLAAAFSLRGLCSLDFVRNGDRCSVLEVNPRPPASMVLYGGDPNHLQSDGLVAAHLRACLHGELPRWSTPSASAVVNGTEIVYAPRALRLTPWVLQQLARRSDCHDLPAAAAQVEAGDPVCSVGVSASSAEQACGLLRRARRAVHQMLEVTP